MHIQRLVCVLTGVFGRLGNVHLVKSNLVDPLAAQVFKREAATPQVAFGQAGQAVRHVHFQHVALQHGVMGIALHFDAMVSKHMAVVFDVLAEF